MLGLQDNKQGLLSASSHSSGKRTSIHLSNLKISTIRSSSKLIHILLPVRKQNQTPTPNSGTDQFSYTFRQTQYLFIAIKDTAFRHVVPDFSVLAHVQFCRYECCTLHTSHIVMMFCSFQRNLSILVMQTCKPVSFQT